MNRCLLASLLLPFFALAIQWLLWPWLAPFVWFLFFPTVFFSARLGGLWGGLASTVLSAGFVWYFFMPPQLSWAMTNPSNLYSVIMFIVMGYLFSDTHERLQKARKNSEAALAETRIANGKITELYQKTLELDELKNQFFANVSHELRTPLTLIISPLTQRLAKTSLSDPQHHEDEMMLRNAKLLYRQVCDLLDAAKLEAGHMSVDYARLDMAGLVRAMASQFESLAKDRHITYHIETSDSVIAEVDAEKLQRIVLNLLSNAFKFTPDQGSITLRLHKNTEQALIEVQDTGPGIPVEFRQTIFERFRQVDGGPQRRFGGTGLGLTIVKEFTELHHGQISVNDAPGGGALFSVSLPRRAPGHCIVNQTSNQLDPIIDALSVEAPPPSKGQDIRQDANHLPMVLIVEDNPDLNAFIADTLRPHYRVSCAYGGQEGLEQAMALLPDLILSDLMMPGLSGDMMVAKIRQQPSLVDTPIVILTARADDALRIRLLEQGVQDYLNKPFSVEELLARINSLINSRQQTQAELLRYGQIVATSNDMLAFVDTQQRYLVANPAYAQLFGRTPEQLKLRRVSEVVGPRIYSHKSPHLSEALAGIAQHFTTETTLPNSEIRILDAEYIPFRQNGEIQGVVVNLRDITEMKTAENALKASEAALREAQHLAALGNWQWDIRSNQHYWSQEIFNIYGRDSSLPPATYPEVQQYFTPDSWARLATMVEQALSDGQPYECDAEVVHTDGSHRWIVARGVACTDADGTITKLYGTVQDITERKQAERAIYDSQKRLQLALDASRDGLWDWDLRTGIVYRSERYFELVGYRPKEGGSNFEFFKTTVHPDDLKRALTCIEDHIQGRSSKIEFDYRLNNTSPMKWLMGRGRIVERDTDGKPVRIVGTLSDITERKATEAQIQLLNADLEHRVCERTAELSTANQELDAFAYAVSHDLRAPLRAMSGFSQALLEDYGNQLQDEGKLYLDQIKIASTKMNGLIDGLLTLSRSTRGDMQHDTVDLSALAAQTLEELKQRYPERKVSVDIQPGLTANGDARMLEVVLRNLLGNAWKYTLHTASPSIRFYTQERDGQLYFCVADNGAGFDMAHTNQLFKPFQRLHRQEEFPGIGIGLATVLRIIHRHGGVIKAQGEPGKGAVFSFTLGNRPSLPLS